MKNSGCRYRAKNSLSRKKFIDRLNKGLPIFVAYGKLNSITRYDDCRKLYWHVFSAGDGTEFVHVTKHYPSWTYKDTNVALTDMNVLRNKYNKNFVFRTRWAAEQYLMEARNRTRR